jgi:hypothetical protein
MSSSVARRKVSGRLEDLDEACRSMFLKLMLNVIGEENWEGSGRTTV